MFRIADFRLPLLFCFVFCTVPQAHSEDITTIGWCQVWSKSDKLKDQKQCKKKSVCDDDGSGICDTFFEWPSGARTTIYRADGFVETLNGKPAKNKIVQGAYCAFSHSTTNTFCFTERPQKRAALISTNCRLSGGGSTYQEDSEAWIELLSGINPKTDEDRQLLCGDFQKVLSYPVSCLKQRTRNEIESWVPKLACDS